MTDPNVTIVCDLRCLHLPRLLENYARAAEPLPTSDGDLEHLFHITSIERLQALTIDDIKKEIQMIMWAHYEVDVCRKDFVLLLDTVRTAANDDSKNQLVKVDHCDSVATVLRQWEMPCGTAAEGVRIRFDADRQQKPCCPWFICRRTRQQIHQGVPCLQSLFSLLLPVCTQILDSVATVLRQWEMPCGTAAEGVRIRFDPCWKNYVQLTSCTWRPFARPLRHQ